MNKIGVRIIAVFFIISLVAIRPLFSEEMQVSTEMQGGSVVEPQEVTSAEGAAVAGQKATPPAEIIVDDFDKGRTMGVFFERSTTLGAFHGTFARRPSYCVITKTDKEKRGKQGLGLAIDFCDVAGWCGWYTLLNDIDVTPYNALSFWVKGSEGNEKFDIGFADAKMQDLEIDAVYAGPVTAFLSKGVSTTWQEVKVPLAKVGSEIDLSRMGSLVFWFRYETKGKIYVDDVKFIKDPEIGKIIDYNLPVSVYGKETERSMWVWKTDPVSNKKQKDELFGFCKRTDINVIYLFFGATPTEEGPEYSVKLAEFLKECHSRGIKVEALTGNPVWSLKEYHETCLSWIKGFLEFNKSRPENERMDGISLDVEPYLTQEWTTNKETIKTDYLELLKKIKETIDSYGQKFNFGMAIPIFYDKEDGGEFGRKVFGYIDYAALMDYYDTPDEIIEKARFHIDMAKQMNKTVFVGVETQNLVEMKQGKPRNTFFEEGWEEMEKVLHDTIEVYKNEASFGGVAIHFYDSYKALTRGRNVPLKDRPADIYTINSFGKGLKEVKIDGDLSEWDISNTYAVEYKDNVVYGQGAWLGTKDLSFKAYSMWEGDALYFAFDVTDDVLFQNKTGADMWEGDHIEFWLDVDLKGDYNEAINSNDDFQFGFSPGNFNNLLPEVVIWTPNIKDEVKNAIQIGAKKREGGYIIEVKIPKEVVLQKKYTQGSPEAAEEAALKLYQGIKLGISVDASDTDSENMPQKCLMSSSVNRVWGDPTTFGILELK